MFTVFNPGLASRRLARVLMRASPVLALGLLAACDQQRISGLEEGLATEADVRARFGEPDKVWTDADMASLPQPGAAAAPGARTFEYDRQPAGQVNYMITLDATGRMSALRQVLTPQNFARVTPGLSMEQVRKMLGKPMKVTTYALKQETHHDWRYIEAPNTAMVFTAVFGPDLRVLRTGSVEEALASPSPSR